MRVHVTVLPICLSQ